MPQGTFPVWREIILTLPRFDPHNPTKDVDFQPIKSNFRPGQSFDPKTETFTKQQFSGESAILIPA